MQTRSSFINYYSYNCHDDPFLEFFFARPYESLVWPLIPNREMGLELMAMDFRRFLHSINWLHAQIACTGQGIIYQILSYDRWPQKTFIGAASAAASRVT